MENLIGEVQSLGRLLREANERLNTLARITGAGASGTVHAGPARGRIESRARTAANIAGHKPTGSRRGTSKPRHRKATINRWVPNASARRVPTFVSALTGGMDSAVAIRQKYGPTAVFSRGKPPPKPLANK